MTKRLEKTSLQGTRTWFIEVDARDITNRDMSGSAFTIGSPLLFVSLALRPLMALFILTSSGTGRQSLRSASRGDFVLPHARTVINQHRAFWVVDPSAWNSLPSEIRSLPGDVVQLVLHAP